MGACTAPDVRLDELLLGTSPPPPPAAPAGTNGLALTLLVGTNGLAPMLDPAVGLLRPGGGTKLGAFSPGGGCGDEGPDAIEPAGLSGVRSTHPDPLISGFGGVSRP